MRIETERLVIRDLERKDQEQFQAIKQDGWTHLITFPIIHLASAIQVLYGGMCTWKNEKKRIWWVVLSALLLVLNIALWIFFW
ncbi:hypothetical protein [Roseburia faecis]|uniref:hypothetical protein n=1 Tax=Roseburia faecis TaxID=301302 RepID=UPI003F9A53BE